MSRLTEEYFSDSYLMPTRLQGAFAESAGESGIVELQSLATRPTLANIAEAVKIKNVMADRATNTYFAIPSPLANVINFETLVRHALQVCVNEGAAALDDLIQEKRALNEWLGMLSLWTSQTVLRAYGINITTDIITLNETNPLQKIMADAMKDIPVFEKSRNKAGRYQLLIFKQNDVPFAIFHPQLMLCPFRYYPVNLFEGKIQWYDCEKDPEDAHNCWEDMTGRIRDGKPCMPQFVLERLMLWVFRNKAMDGDSDLLYCLLQLIDQDGQKTQTELMEKLGSYSDMISNQPMQTYINQMIPEKQGAGSSFLTLDGQLELPNIFLPQIMLVNIETGNADAKSSSFMMQDKRPWRLEFEKNADLPEEVDSVMPLLPCGFGTMQDLSAKKLRIEDAAFRVRLADNERTDVGEIERIEVAVTLRREDSNDPYEITHTYYSNQIVTGVLPFVSVWPYISLPANTWKNYYACSAEQKRGKTVYALIPHKVIDPNSEDQSYLEELPEVMDIEAQFPYSRTCDCEDYNNPREQNKWKIALSAVMFPFVSFYKELNGNHQKMELGSILIDECPALTKEEMKYQETFRLGVDLGTTSTLCGCMAINKDGKPVTGEADMLVLRDYSRIVTYADSGEISKIMNEWWLPDLESNGRKGKFLTIAQLFQGGRVDPGNGFIHRPYINGRICFLDSDLLNQLAGKEDENKEGRDPLLERKVFNNIKESEDDNSDTAKAARIFMTNLLMFGVLEGLSRGYYQFELRCSYPSKGYLGRLSGMWQASVESIRNYVVEQPAGDFPFKFDQKIFFFTEAKSVMGYEKHVGQANMDNYVIIDIGGGTTDISLIGNKDVSAYDEERECGTTVDAEVSLKYAGRRIINDSITECMRYGTRAQHEAPKTAMEELWKATFRAQDPMKPNGYIMEMQEGARNLVVMFEQICREVDIYGPHAGQEYVKLVNGNRTVKEIVEVLLDKVGLKDYMRNQYYYLLRNIIVFKYFMLFYMVAEFIKSNKGKISFKESNDKLINIFIAGTGAKGLEIIMGKSLSHMQGDPVMESIRRMICDVIDEPDIELNLTLSNEVEQKKEVCLGMLFLEEEEGLMVNHMINSGKKKESEKTDQIQKEVRKMVDSYGNKEKRQQVTDFVEKIAGYLKNYDSDRGLMPPQESDGYLLKGSDGERIEILSAAEAARIDLMPSMEIQSMINNMASKEHILENLVGLDNGEDKTPVLGELMTQVYIVETVINQNLARAQLEMQKTDDSTGRFS